MDFFEKWHGLSRYQIKVKGLLGSKWSSWFEGMTIETEGSATVITGELPDQSALHGLIVKIRDLGLPLISIKRIQKSMPQTGSFQKDQNNKK
ncbi:MAG: hypothetical protein H8D87_14400 [Deltaproteobacteria bacterium]|uniref:hypothetical protein n=1 Tax=Desulfobacula sp. TaxID=2593537 RepID=UPI0019A31213|nr:hypothetical protein [Candidatus Desulfobacula maris]MBL6993638.1 hypothetical protein [Desulfobacula sp.]